MNLSGPKRLSWWLAVVVWIGVILGILGIIARLVPGTFLSGNAFKLLTAGWFLLAGAAAGNYLFVIKKL